MKKLHLLVNGYYLFLSLLLILFTYTQVDLGLTLSKASILQAAQKAFQQIGFYNRPLATSFYVGILFFLYVGYWLFLYFIAKGKIKRRTFWSVLIVSSILFIFSYPAAFSYDVFNYVFTAKTILLYQRNPYELIPLALQGVDPLLSVMRWTHLPSAYTPIWILLTLPAYIFSFGSLLLNLYLLKFVVVISFLFCVWLLGESAKVIDKKNDVFAMAFFALNPLVFIEVLVSAHNDIVMMLFAILSLFFYFKRKKLASFFLLSLSISIKFMTIFLLPVFILRWHIRYAVFFILIGLSIVLLQREFLSWYFLWVLPFLALLQQKKFVLFLSSGVSLGLLLRYAPVLYLSSFVPADGKIQHWLLFGPILTSLLCYGVFLRIRSRLKS